MNIRNDIQKRKWTEEEKGYCVGYNCPTAYISAISEAKTVVTAVTQQAKH